MAACAESLSEIRGRPDSRALKWTAHQKRLRAYERRKRHEDWELTVRYHHTHTRVPMFVGDLWFFRNGGLWV